MEKEVEMESASLKLLELGGPEELTALFSQLRPHLRKMIEIRLDRRLHSRVDASDIVQETYVRARQGLTSFLESPKMDPTTWLRLISKHLIAEIHRHHFRSIRSPEREQNWEDDNSDLLINRIADSIHSIGAAIDQKQLLDRVRIAMDQLSFNDREIIEMRHVDEMSIQQAADILGIAFEAAKKRYHRALSRFRELTAELHATS